MKSTVKVLRLILLGILLGVPSLKFAQNMADESKSIENQEDSIVQELEKEDRDGGEETRFESSGARGRVYVYYGTGYHRPYSARSYEYHTHYPFAPYHYRYYYHPYQRASRYLEGEE